jgi:5'-nucleotidase
VVGGLVLVAPQASAAVPTHTIAQVQGTGATTPLPIGTVVTVEGIVTGDLRTGGYRGLYVQTAGSGGTPDQTPGASDGIFVFTQNATHATVDIGDLVDVTGAVSEFNTVTQITANTEGSIELVTDEAGLPTVANLPANVVGSAREAFEGMLVLPTAAGSASYRVVSSHNLQSFGELWTSVPPVAASSACVPSGAMPVEAFENQPPTTAAAACLTTSNNNARLLVDDGYSIRVDNAAHPGDQPYFTKDTVVRNGDTVTFPATGMLLSFDFGNWRLQPPTPLNDASPSALKPTFTPTNLRTPEAPEVDGDITVAAFNVLNYFTTLTSENPNARGAATAEQFAIQKSKIVAAINKLNADIVALQEIENSPKLGEAPDEALANLVAGLNAAAGSQVWDYVRTPAALHDAAITDFITNAIIYKRGVVKTSGEALTTVDESVWDIAREPIAQTFKYGKSFVTVVANHFKSKSGTDPTPQTGQDAFNDERVEQAQALKTWIDSVADGRKSSVYLVGDFNSSAKEDPIKVFTDAGWTDVLFSKARGQYTYTFDGELQSLDHVIASPAGAKRVTKAAVWPINSPEWVGREYWNTATEAGTPFRSSDHDPIVVGVGQSGLPSTVDIDLVTVNDFHGRIEQAAPAGGIAALSSAVKAIRAGNPNTVFAAAGDMIGASTFTSFIQQDVPTIEALNAAGLDVSSVGNHEFDQGFADLTDRVMPMALWDYLGANIYHKGTTDPALPEYWTQEFDGVTIGFVGAVTDELPSLVSPAGIATIDVGDPGEAANRVAAQLSDGDDANGEADIVVLLVHEGAVTTDVSSATDASTRFGEIVHQTVMQPNSNIDAIVSGHTHLAYNHVINGHPVISSGQYGERYSKMDITFDKQTKTFTMKNQIFTMMDGNTALYPNDPAVTPIVADAVAVASELGSVVLGTATADFGRAVSSQPVAGQSFPENRGGESTLGNLVADVQLWALEQDGTRDVDVAFMNPGGLRADLAGGEVTYKEAADVQPFANSLMTLELTAAQIKSVLEEQWQPPTASRPFLKLGINKEFTYTYDPSAAKGSHITEMWLNGTKLDTASPTKYLIGANSFLASGGDSFFTLAQGTNRADSGQIDLEGMVDYFAEFGTVSPDVKQRAVGVKVQGDGTYAPGESVTVDLSSLDFSRNEPAAGTVEVTFDGVTLASQIVNRAFTPTVDEIGKATVTFQVPPTADGPTRFGISVPGTGTTSSFLLNVVGAG